MFSIAAWKQGVEVLNAKPQMGYRELSRQLDIDPFDARELIDNYRFIFKVPQNKRGGVKKEVVKTKKEINAKYYDKHIRKSPLSQKYSSRSVASQSTHFINSNNY